MAWTNGPLTLYHGTIQPRAASIRTGIRLSASGPFNEFGPGFYTTPDLQQAIEHANRLYNLPTPSAATPAPVCAVVIQFEIDRDALSGLASLWFASDTPDWHYFTDWCRLGGSHKPFTNTYYDVVSGPIRNSKRRAEPRPFEQVSFHSKAAIKLLSWVTSISGSPTL